MNSNTARLAVRALAVALPALAMPASGHAQPAQAAPAQAAPPRPPAAGAPAPAPALLHTAPIRATYNAFIAGMRVLELEVEFALAAQRYEVVTTFRTAGMLATFVDGQQTSRVVGITPADPSQTLRPERYSMEGVWRGNQRRILMDYENGAPRLRALVPPNDAEREPVPEGLRQGTVDMLTALAELTRAVALTGRCEGSANTFDGRRRTDFSARTIGTEQLERSSRGIFAGEALACGFEGRQVAGFMAGYDRAEMERKREGRAWMARLIADAPPIPVRLTADSGWVGTAQIHLTKVERGTPREAVGRQTPN
jgi:hypothetical protein